MACGGLDLSRAGPSLTVARKGALGWVLVVLGVALAVVAVLLVVRPDRGLQPWSPDGADPQEYASQLVAETNEARADEGLPALTVSECAVGEADLRAEALVGEELEHAPMTAVLEACPPSTVAAENLSRAAATPHDVADAWLASAGHRANLLDPSLEQVGIGCLLDDGEMLCSQVFLGP